MDEPPELPLVVAPELLSWAVAEVFEPCWPADVAEAPVEGPAPAVVFVPTPAFDGFGAFGDAELRPPYMLGELCAAAASFSLAPLAAPPADWASAAPASKAALASVVITIFGFIQLSPLFPDRAETSPDDRCSPNSQLLVAAVSAFC